ncbi:3-isopropylmalate dehydratase small subunit [Xylophilus sp. GOD-11R]|uniref:3-isopropylmalate dehydratase small subunit n=1 Tax=Xylophilus sp. GOD-11R TaxID=3089814 RepID=UPI00298CE1CC|nr:3-isopropylmalate dehydratase small subunit [Xylophilus sp. GOD-11R]WPB57307.1 3-isopropylmalate dehydratase small subunit [Xylophilus sp. GOD-11R]
MTPFTIVHGPAVPLLIDNLDTDAIIRIDRLAAFGRQEIGPFALETLRQDPRSVLNRPEFAAAPILLGGRNFGCGSSREGAVWALAGYGFRSVVAESFGDIFFNNCFQNGVLPIRLERAKLERLAALADGGDAVTVDLVAQRLTFPDGSSEPIVVDAMKRAALLDGLDDVTRTLRKQDAIAEWQAGDRGRRPWVWEGLGGGGRTGGG